MKTHWFYRLSSSLRATLNRPAVQAVLSLAILAGLAAIVLFRGLPSIQTRYFAVGDLPGYYTFPPIPWAWFTSLAVYPSMVLVFSSILGIPAGQTVSYLASLFLPSLGFLAVFTVLRIRRSIAVVVALVSGTPINPIWTSNFLMGGAQFGLWAFFTLLGLACLLKIKDGQRTFTWLLLSGGAFGLTAAQAGTFGNFLLVGLVMSTAILLPFLVWILATSRTDPKRAALRFVTWVGVALLVTLPLWLSYIEPYLLVTGSSGQVADIANYATTNATYTFQSYSLFNALFDSPLRVATTWNAVFVPAWFVLVVLAIVLASWTSLSRTYRHREVVRIALLEYVLAVLCVAGVHSGSLLWVYRDVPLAAFFSNPTYFLYPQSILLGILLGAGSDHLVDGVSGLLARTSTPTSTESGPERPVSTATCDGAVDRPPFPSSTVRRSVRTISPTLAVVVLCLGVGTAAAFAPNLANQVENSWYADGQSPFASPALASLHSWYVSQAGQGTSDILSLPNTEVEGAHLAAYIPASRMWVIPYTGTLTSRNYNATVFSDTMNLIAENQTRAFAQALANQGVRFVILDNASPQVLLVPSWMGSQLTMPYSTLADRLDNSSFLVPCWRAGPYTVYGVSDALEKSGQSSRVAWSEGNSNSGVLLTTGALLNPYESNASAFQEWNRWPADAVNLLPNGSVSLQINGSSATPYALLADLIDLNLPGVSGTQAVPPPIPPESYSQVFQVTGTVRVPLGVALDVEVFWYNTTPSPPLYSQFEVSSLQVVNTGNSHFTENFTAPNGARAARLYLYASTTTPNLLATAYLSTLNVTTTITPVNLELEPDTQLDMLGNLTTTDGMPFAGIALFPPLFSQPNITGMSTLYQAPAVIGDPLGSLNFTSSISSFVGDSFHPSIDSEVFLSGTAWSSGSLYFGYVGGPATSLRVNPGEAFLARLNASTASSDTSIETNTTASLTYDSIGYFSNETRAASSQPPQSYGSYDTPLSVGTLEIGSSNDGFEYARVLTMSTSNGYQTVLTISEIFPILSVPIVTFVTWPQLVPTRLRRNGNRSTL
jgi:hypothetical protein